MSQVLDLSVTLTPPPVGADPAVVASITFSKEVPCDWFRIGGGRRTMQLVEEHVRFRLSPGEKE